MSYHSRCHPEYCPRESKRGSLRVSTPSTPTSGTHYRERVSRATEQECAGSITMPERPVPVLRAHRVRTPPTGRAHALRCAALPCGALAVRRLTAPARPPAPLRVRRRRMRVLRVPCRAPCRAGYRDIVRRGDPPRPRDALPLGGDPPCRVRLRFAAGRALGILLRYSGISCKYSQYREYREHPMRTTHRDVSWQLCCPM